MRRPFYPPQATRVHLPAKYNASHDLGQSVRRSFRMIDSGTLEVPDFFANDTPEMLFPWVTERELQDVMDRFHQEVVEHRALLKSLEQERSKGTSDAADNP